MHRLLRDAEQRWGAAIGLDTFCYVTVGTGIGGGVVANGRVLHGLLHPEVGHMRIPHDLGRDPFPGICPYHSDYFEGLASGEAIAGHWPKARSGEWPAEVLELEARYLALGLVNVVGVLSPQRIVLGGGVMKEPGLLERVRERVRELAGGYARLSSVTASPSTSFFPPSGTGPASSAPSSWPGVLSRTREGEGGRSVWGFTCPLLQVGGSWDVVAGLRLLSGSVSDALL